MTISTDVKWEIFPQQNYRLHRIVIDWKGVSAVKDWEWDGDNAFSSIFFQGSVAIQEPKIEFFDGPIPKSSGFKSYITALISTFKITRKSSHALMEEKRDLDVIPEKSGLNTIIKINLNKFDDELNLFEQDDFTTVITFKEGRSTRPTGNWTYENLNFQPHLFSTSHNVSFYLPKIHFLKRIVHYIFNISNKTNHDVVWFPIEHDPEIKSDKLVFLISEDKMGLDQQIWYSPPEINSFQLIIRGAGILFIAFLQTFIQFILSIWNT